MLHSEAAHRYTALTTLSCITEGCSDFLRNEFRTDLLLSIIVSGLNDAEYLVRRAACMCLGTLSSHLDSHIGAHHAALIPLIFNLLHDPNELVRKSACESLDSILETLGADIQPYLPLLMEKLMLLIDQADDEVKLTITSAIGSAAHASGEVVVF